MQVHMEAEDEAAAPGDDPPMDWHSLLVYELNNDMCKRYLQCLQAKTTKTAQDVLYICVCSILPFVAKNEIGTNSVCKASDSLCWT